MLYGTITEFCTEQSCPVMSAGPKYEYHWADGQTVKKPIKCSAPKYIDYLMTWVQDQLDDETLFPSKIGRFSPYMWFFLQICLNFVRLLLRTTSKMGLNFRVTYLNGYSNRQHMLQLT